MAQSLLRQRTQERTSSSVTLQLQGTNRETEREKERLSDVVKPVQRVPSNAKNLCIVHSPTHFIKYCK